MGARSREGFRPRVAFALHLESSQAAQHGELAGVCQRVGDPALEDPARLPPDGLTRGEVAVQGRALRLGHRKPEERTDL